MPVENSSLLSHWGKNLMQFDFDRGLNTKWVIDTTFKGNFHFGTQILPSSHWLCSILCANYAVQKQVLKTELGEWYSKILSS